MNAITQIQNSEQPALSFENTGEKSELMQVFEEQVHDMYWAYKDLLKAIFEQQDLD